MFQQRWITIFLIVLITIFGIHIIYENTDGWRADLTEGGLYTLTDGTHEILDKMSQEGVKPINIKLYFSLTAGKSLPKFIKNFITYDHYVQNLLKEYRRYSSGKINLEFIDPKTDTDAAQDAEDYGLDGKPINQQGDVFYFGIVFETQTGSKDTIEFLWPEQQETIEYEISKRIYNLLWPSKKRIGVLSSLEVLSDSSNPYYAQMLAAQGKQPKDSWITMQLLQESYEVKPIDLDTDFISPEEYDLVMVIHPKNFTDKTLWALDEWIVTGGNTMIFLDPFCIEDQAPQNPQQPFAAYQYKPSSNLSKLLEKWGLARPEDQIAADFDMAVKRPVSRTGVAQKVLVDLSVNDAVRKETLDLDSPILKGLKNLRFYMAGTLTKKPDSPVALTPLITSTPKGNTLTMKPGFPGKELTFMDANDPGKMMDAFTNGTEAVVLAHLAQGQFPTAFPEGARFPESTPEPPPGLPPGVQMPPDEDAEWIEKEAVAPDTYKEATVLVFADVDFITDRLAFQQTFLGNMAANDNYKVLLNAVDFMLGSKELMNVRSKSSIRRPFVLFDQIEEKADAETLDQERMYRAEVERFQNQLQEKQSQLNQQNAPLLEKKMRDELSQLKSKKSDAERKLREIRKQKRAALEFEEAKVRFATIWFMPIVVFILGMVLWFRRKAKKLQAKGGAR